MSVAHEWLAEGDLLSVPGWEGAAVRCGLKPSGDLDLAILRADAPRIAVGLFTRNELPAAPVVLGRETLGASPYVRSIVINAGNANALTGSQGYRDAQAMQLLVEERCGGPALVLSTGVIGVPLPLSRVEAGIATAAGQLAPHCPEVAQAILTTDTRPKHCALQVELPGATGQPARSVTVGGVAKGSGMIHPNMATMLAVVAVDAAIERPALDAIARRTNDRSFHEISVDGDTSTNDTVLLLARDPATQPPCSGEQLVALEFAIEAVMQHLAQAIVADGEGCTRTLLIDVRAARTDAEARRVADSVAGSSLVKTALAGGDPNWGRLLAAAANAQVPLAQERLALEICGTPIFGGGGPLPFDAAALARDFSGSEVDVAIDLGSGVGTARRWTCDLSSDYVRINSEYTT